MLQSDAKSKEYLKVKNTLEEKTKESNEHKLKIQEVIGKAEPLMVCMSLYFCYPNCKQR